LTQDRVAIDKVYDYIKDKVSMGSLLRKL
jgi:hypothetical protein